MPVADLECHDVLKAFGATVAVDGVSLSVAQGSFFSILGPSGCGKTTLMRMIAGFVQPNAGDIRIKGASVLGTPPNQRPVNMVFQHLALFPMMNVAENIGYGLRRRGMKSAEIDRRVDDVLRRIGLPDAAAKRIDQLSGGQKQRVAIARCIVLDPAVLLLDEPLGALDLKLREHMKLELKQLQHQFGTTFVYITHDQSEALVMSDHVAVMQNGRFEQIASPQDLYYRPATAFVAGFVGDSHRWRGRVERDEGGCLQVLTESGLLLSATANGRPAVGGTVEVFVRPESITLAAPDILPSDAGDGTNRHNGVLESLLFNGANSRVLVRLPQGDLVSAALPPDAAALTLAEGTQLRASFRASQTLAFPVA
jgi:spermidine/putrescine transport system ATP-binding protein